MVDCLIIGYNEQEFANEVENMKSIGLESVSYKDFRLGHIHYNNQPKRVLDLMEEFINENNTKETVRLHNADVLWQSIMCTVTALHKNDLTYDYVNLAHIDQDEFKHKLMERNPLAIAVTSSIYVDVSPLLDIISKIREYNETAKLIIGGSYVSKQLNQLDVDQRLVVFELLDADFYINSLDGTQTLVNLLKEMKASKNYGEIKNIVYRENEDYIINETSEEQIPLEDNMIQYDLFSHERTYQTINIRTSQSCPFSCSYCAFPLRSSKYQCISLERFEREMNDIKRHLNIEYIFFIDDTFNVPPKRFKDLLRLMIKNEYNFKWYSFYRCDYGDEEMVQLMKRAGCVGIFLGIESTDPDVLDNMNKKAREEHYIQNILWFQKYDILIFASTIIGFPGDTPEKAYKTMEFIESHNIEYFRPQIWWCDVDTPIYHNRDKYGIVGQGFNWTHDTMNSSEAYQVFENIFQMERKCTWVPDPGFNYTSIFYLMQKGYGKDQIKNLLEAFNKIVSLEIKEENQAILNDKHVKEELLRQFKNIAVKPLKGEG